MRLGLGLRNRHLLLLTMTETKGVADKFDDMSAMGETIQKGEGKTLIAKDLSPIGKVEIGGHDQGSGIAT